MRLLDYIKGCGIDVESSGGEFSLADGNTAELLINPETTEFCVAENQNESVVVLHTSADNTAKLSFDVGPCGKLNLVEVFLAGAFAECNIRQQTGSVCDITSIVVADAIADYTIDLNGKQASNVLRSAFVVADKERTRVNVRVNHNFSDCTSDSLVKGVAAGEAVGEFNGLVYVAPDAQRTDARQTSRNIEIGRESKIITKPQLEIYADDVKCSHGATVGQLDGEAIMYMRQRGLSETQARKLQIEGFVKDIALSSKTLSDELSDELNAKLENI